MVAPRDKVMFGIAVYVIMLFSIVARHNAEARAPYCRDQNEALSLVLPCVTSGNVQARPSKVCCVGIQQLVSQLTLNCMCEILISVGGASTPSLVKSYVQRCSLKVPPNFVCKL
ncbi:hypothetical protein GOP47_0011594 [Adiantum capillus-veneris]|uniref:Bifunctional inhibitor/plant lipid transfer protein/seed storage helical domain-containing protein n=1 Tax=Adiantum capillus-veneris TaxID=13818 RepID=A0A9D4UT89_ADICA|nr:hypothetical protein GOP47_0011594 [Adiantum capillus-veneris]